MAITPPWIMGADGAGVVDKLGDGVDSVVAGDRVVINPGISDGTCEYCERGEQSLCVRFGLLGEHFPGTLAEFVVVPARNVRRIESGFDGGGCIPPCHSHRLEDAGDARAGREPTTTC